MASGIFTGWLGGGLNGLHPGNVLGSILWEKRVGATLISHTVEVE